MSLSNLGISDLKSNGDSLVVLWEDPHGLAVAKPAGLLTQGKDSGEVTLEAMVRSYLRSDDPSSVYLGTVHRLDRPVSGVILWAKTPKAARRWAEQFASRETIKEYWAIVEIEVGGEGSPIATSGTWVDWLASPDPSGRARVVDAGSEGAVRASTRFELGQDPAVPSGCRWLRLWPETGRTHQLRVQSSIRGSPIVGDSIYGSRRPFGAGIALHARSLTVEHPITRRSIAIEAPLPGSWSSWLS
jgi:23S rRNA pseudouridine1911/1915/1917 synthase